MHFAGDAGFPALPELEASDPKHPGEALSKLLSDIQAIKEKLHSQNGGRRLKAEWWQVKFGHTFDTNFASCHQDNPACVMSARHVKRSFNSMHPLSF